MASPTAGKAFLLSLGSALWLNACHGPSAVIQEPLVDIRTVAPGIRIDMPYATNDNFTKHVLYPVSRCLLRESVAKRLASVESDLEPRGLGLKVWDCYRPLSIQRELWARVPDPRFVADPRKGSRHNRGAAVDATLVDASGKELEMPTGFDDFTPRAFRSDASAPPKAIENRRRLEAAMSRHGFVGLPTEWWHFDAEGWERFPLTDVPLTP